MNEINPKDTSRARAFEKWINAPQPMVTLIKTFNIKNLLNISRNSDLKINMLLCYCIGKAAKRIDEFFLLPKEEKLFTFDKLAINLVVKCSDGEIRYCDVPFCEDLKEFNKGYLDNTKIVFESNNDFLLENDYMIIGTSTIKDVYIDGAINMYSGIFTNPFLIWGKYKEKKNKAKLPISFQFHHAQLDGEQAGKFLNNLKEEITKLEYK